MAQGLVKVKQENSLDPFRGPATGVWLAYSATGLKPLASGCRGQGKKLLGSSPMVVSRGVNALLAVAI